jgi:hypothetical protein
MRAVTSCSTTGVRFAFAQICFGRFARIQDLIPALLPAWWSRDRELRTTRWYVNAINENDVEAFRLHARAFAFGHEHDPPFESLEGCEQATALRDSTLPSQCPDSFQLRRGASSPLAAEL